MRQHSTADWITQYRDVWREVFAPLIGKEAQGLEVGSYEGESACMILENILTHPKSFLACVDRWDGVDPCLGGKTVTAETHFDANTKPFIARLGKWKCPSLEGLMILHRQRFTFDLIFIDGDHEAQGALSDLVLSWPLLKVGGILAFDDYGWQSPLLRHQPSEAWHAFFDLRDDFERVHTATLTRQRFTRKTK